MSDASEMSDGHDAHDAQLMLDYAYYYFKNGEIEEAINAATEARDLFDELQMPGGSAEARLVLGFIHHQSGEFKSALPLLASAQQQFASLNLFHQQCATLYLLAFCHLGLEKPSKAIYSLKLACNILDNPPGHNARAEPERVSFLPDLASLDVMIRKLYQQLIKDTEGKIVEE